MDSPTLLTAALVRTALSSEALYSRLPEFKPLGQQLKTMKLDLRDSGCTGCTKRRIESNLFGAFTTIVTNLNPARVAILKDVLGISGMIVRARDTRTGAFITKRL